MPELPEVETVRSGLEPVLVGRTINDAICYRQSLRYPLPDFSKLTGSKITSLNRRSKYLLFALDDGQTLVWHLGMTGQFHVLPGEDARAKHEHVRIDLHDGQSLRYRDARRFGYAGLLASDTLMSHAWFAGLGPEPLGDEFHSDYLVGLCKARKAPIKTIIMDATNVVGVGNIYAAESLFRAGIHPARAAGRISKQRLAMLVEVIRQVLREAIEAGGSTISDFVKADGKPGYFAHSFQVYGRADKSCLRCGKVIKRMTQAGRSSFYCPHCQR
ncbi:formamidopyrimidine-DNA glycosylase [Mariprofundus micogutta]|uniref:Formamidopyrimidine-DNA glycosylase n=1 Tax=Mariprofundus micogutta TaxID=1921010 RepID=A0A1L8CM46_9PROT|nr:bifunctional DNA-formamidopyrimidine glycosylase/DNA-(apurinic or apyrimidinic site) lyase [Mariprofundus micogutta]GAV19983.1 formamidopyrimidine-DNA glycosylase [Mariprofundus micogutta]